MRFKSPAGLALSPSGVIVICFLTIITLVPTITQGAPSDDGDEDIDALINEFYEDTKQGFTIVKPVAKNDEDNNRISALNAQSKYLKKDSCNCTKFFMCDVNETKESLESLEESEEESVEGADITLINIRLNVPKGGCAHYLDLCCDKLKPTLPGSTSPLKGPIRKSSRICGKINVGGVGFRIVDPEDSEAQFGEFPWMAALTEQRLPRYPDEKPIQKFLCGSSLIHPRVVLTAAHCIQNKTASNLRVRLGEWDTQTTAELYPHQDLEVERVILYDGTDEQVILHEAYDRRKYLRNDIGLVILKDEAELAPHIAPICLPPVGTNLDGARCFATGWGKNEYGQEGLYSSILKKVEVPIVPRSDCQQTLRSTRLGNRFKLHDSFICAGGEPGRDTCKGDGGSPLVCQMPGTDYFVQYGIVSWGIGCGTHIPAVYANIPKFTSWIEQQIIDAGFDTKYFHPNSVNF